MGPMKPCNRLGLLVAVSAMAFLIHMFAYHMGGMMGQCRCLCHRIAELAHRLGLAKPPKCELCCNG